MLTGDQIERLIDDRMKLSSKSRALAVELMEDKDSDWTDFAMANLLIKQAQVVDDMVRDIREMPARDL